MGKALNDLVTDVTQAMAVGQLQPADPLTSAFALWSAMHGVAAPWTVTPSLPVMIRNSSSYTGRQWAFFDKKSWSTSSSSVPRGELSASR
jgi:hypothetical protein